MDYQTELWEKYLVTGDWSQSTARPSCQFRQCSEDIFFSSDSAVVYCLHKNWQQSVPKEHSLNNTYYYFLLQTAVRCTFTVILYQSRQKKGIIIKIPPSKTQHRFGEHTVRCQDIGFLQIVHSDQRGLWSGCAFAQPDQGPLWSHTSKGTLGLGRVDIGIF